MQVSLVVQTLFELTPELFDQVIAVNVKGCLLCAQAVAKVMIEQGIHGRIINNSSIYAEESHVGGTQLLCQQSSIESVDAKSRTRIATTRYNGKCSRTGWWGTDRYECIAEHPR